MRNKLVAGRSAKDTEPFYRQWNLASADYYKQHHVDPSQILSIQASIAGQKKSVVDLTKSLNNVEAFSANEKATLQQILELSNKIPDTGSPLINDVVRGVAVKGLGDQDLADLRTMLTTTVPGIARILNSPNMTGVVSEEARQEVNKMLAGDMPAAQMKRVIGRILVEMDQRRVGYSNQIKQAQYGMQVPGSNVPPPVPEQMPTLNPGGAPTVSNW